MVRGSASNASITENNNTFSCDKISNSKSDYSGEFQKNGRFSQSAGFLVSGYKKKIALPKSNSFCSTEVRNNVECIQSLCDVGNEKQIGIERREAISTELLYSPENDIASESDSFDTLSALKQHTAASQNSTTASGFLPKDANHSNLDPSLSLDSEIPSPSPGEFFPPDGGYGWVVAVAACFANIWTIGFMKCYSLLYLEITEKFPGSSAYEASWIPVMLSTIGLLVSPLIGALCSRYRVRTIASVGGFLCFLGIFLSAFATTLMQMVLTMGVLTGLGSGLVQTPAILIVNMYFNKRRALASAICVSGNALGGFFIPPLMEYLLKEFRLQGALLITASLQLHILLSTFLFRPTRDHALVQARQKREEIRKKELLQSEENIPTKKRPRKNSLMNFAELNFSRRMSSKPSFEKVHTSLVLSELDRTKEAITQELSMYRSMTLTGSALNLRVFSETSAQPTCQIFVNSKIDFNRSRSRDLPKAQHRETSIPLNNDHTISKKPLRTRSQSESTAYEHISTADNIGDFIIPTPKTQQQVPKKEQISLLRFAVVNTATRNCRPVDNSTTSLASSDYDGLSFSTEISPNVENHTEENLSDVSQPLLNESGNAVKPKCCEEASSQQDIVLCHGDELDETEKQSVSSHGSSKSNICLKIMRSCFDKEVLKTSSMIFSCISTSLFAVGAPHTLFYVHAYFTSVDVDSRVVTKLLAITSIVDLAGRLIVGYVADMNAVSLTLLYFLCTGLAGISCLCVPFVQSVAGIATVLCGYGFGIGGFVVLQPTTLARNHGIDKLACSFSFVKMLHGVMNFISPQVCGVITDLTGSFAAVYYFMGTAMILSSVMQKSRDPTKKASEKEPKHAIA